MSNEAKDRTKRLLTAFWESRSMEVTLGAAKLWLDSLSDLTAEQIEIAVRRCSREHSGFVTPAELRKFAPGGLGLSDAERAEIAWTEVLQAVRSQGSYESVEFSDRICNAVIRDMGGWEWLCGQQSDEMKWIKRDFVARYEIVASCGVGDGSPLPGICERENRDRGLHDEVKASLVETRLPVHMSASRLTYETIAERVSRLEHTQSAVRKALPAPDTDDVESSTEEVEAWKAELRIRPAPRSRRLTTKQMREEIQSVAIRPEQQAEFDEKRQKQVEILAKM